MTHDYNTRGNRDDGNASNDDDPLANANLKENIINMLAAPANFI